MTTAPDPAIVLGLYREGLDALAALLGELPDDETKGRWHRTVTEDWSATELCRHLLAVADWYHQWLDRAEAGDSSAPFPVRELDDRNELEVYDRRAISGPDAARLFLVRASSYLDRLNAAAESSESWDLPYGYAFGTATTGLHAGGAASEWHLHAWDLSGGDWQPTDARSLYLAVGALMTARQPLPMRLVTRRVVWLISRRDPWGDLLKRSGR